MRNLCFMYEGAVTAFGVPLTNRWVATTYAPSKEKALSNFKYRYKRSHRRTANARLELPGKITVLEGF